MKKQYKLYGFYPSCKSKCVYVMNTSGTLQEISVDIGAIDIGTINITQQKFESEYSSLLFNTKVSAKEYMKVVKKHTNSGRKAFNYENVDWVVTEVPTKIINGNTLIHEKIEIVKAFRDCDENVLVFDVDNTLTIGELKEIIIRAMLKERCILDDKARLDDWEIDDVKIWHFNDWLMDECFFVK